VFKAGSGTIHIPTGTLRLHGMTHSNQILHGDRTRWEENFHRLDHVASPGHNFVTQMLKRDLFSVANLAFWRTILMWELFRLSSAGVMSKRLYI